MLGREEVAAFLSCLDEERYYDAHEVLLLKGLINASVSFELHKRGRGHKAQGPWSVYMKYREHLQQIGERKPLYFELDEAVHRVQKMLNG